MSYEELEHFIDDTINKSGEYKKALSDHKPEILTALTGFFENDSIANQREQQQLIELWQNQSSEKSQFLFRKRYIRISDFMISFLEAFLAGGLCDALIAKDCPISNALSVSVVSSMVFAIYHTLKNAATLDDNDFCLYIQLTEKYYEVKEFTKEDVLSWYPKKSICNIEKHKWNCLYYGEDGKCEIESRNIENTIESLVSKGILKIRYERDKTVYQFNV